MSDIVDDTGGPMTHEFTGMADDGFGTLTLVPDELMPTAIGDHAAETRHCDVSTKQGPYSVAHFSVGGFYAVRNARGENCLRFTSNPGAVFTGLAAVAALTARKFDTDYGVLR